MLSDKSLKQRSNWKIGSWGLRKLAPYWSGGVNLGAQLVLRGPGTSAHPEPVEGLRVPEQGCGWEWLRWVWGLSEVSLLFLISIVSPELKCNEAVGKPSRC